MYMIFFFSTEKQQQQQQNQTREQGRNPHDFEYVFLAS